MKLLDAAEVKTQARGGWEHGWDGDSRVCGGIHIYLSECDPDATADVLGTGDTTVEDCGYRVIPFGIVADLTRNVRAERPDDASWLSSALKESSEIPVARGLLVQQGMGSTLGDTWLGNPLVDEVTAPTMTDGPAVVAALSEGRRRFFAKTIGIQPILHVNPDNTVQLVTAGVLHFDPPSGEFKTVWGDPVVVSEGYYDIDGMTSTPVAFWTGPIEITLSDVNEEEVIRASRMNRVQYQVTRIAAIDTAPCAIVRIGPAPAPAG